MLKTGWYAVHWSGSAWLGNKLQYYPTFITADKASAYVGQDELSPQAIACYTEHPGSVKLQYIIYQLNCPFMIHNFLYYRCKAIQKLFCTGVTHINCNVCRNLPVQKRCLQSNALWEFKKNQTVSMKFFGRSLTVQNQ